MKTMSTMTAVVAAPAPHPGVGVAIRAVEASLSMLRRELAATGRRDVVAAFGSIALPVHSGLELVRDLVADDREQREG